MEFRHLKVASEGNAATLKYLTQNLTDPEAGREVFRVLVQELGNSVNRYPEWHPILTLPSKATSEDYNCLYEVPFYRGADHTRYFVRGFVTCPYSEDTADELVDAVSKVDGLTAHRLKTPLYMDNAYPVVVEAHRIAFEGDGTIRSQDAIAWFTEKIIKNAMNAQVAETWWTMRPYLLGAPHGSRSSLLVNQHMGGHIRKILETLNDSGVFGLLKNGR